MDTKLLEHLLYLESKSRRLRESTFDPQEMYWADIREILSGHYHLSDAGKYEVSTHSDLITEMFINGKTALIVQKKPEKVKNLASDTGLKFPFFRLSISHLWER